MKQHKWHKEIKHLADGGEIEYRTKLGKGIWSDWSVWDEDYFPEFNNDVSDEEYRIKPQPKEPQVQTNWKYDPMTGEPLIDGWPLYSGLPNPKCKTHPDAPHGFCRDASHSEDRYVCECEFWEEPKEPQSIPSYKGDSTPTHVKEPKYLYVYLDDNYEFSPIPLTGEWEYIGKIKLEVED